MEKSKRKILFLITKSNWGGAQRYVYDLATNLPTDDFEVAVASGGEGELINNLKLAGVKTITLPSLTRDISVSKEIKTIFEVIKIIREEKPDIIHINSSKAGLIGAIAGRICLVPKIIFTAHGWAFNEDRPAWQRFIFKTLHYLTVLLADQTIAVAYEVKQQLNWPLIARKITVIYNGRQPINFQDKMTARTYLANTHKELTSYLNDTWSLTIAELHPIKRHDLVIKAQSEVIKTKPNHRHLIIGAGQAETELQQLITDNHLTENVFLLGSIPEAAQYLKVADIFILASHSEAMPYVIIETLMAGLPIIATNVGGIKEMITNQQNGLLIPDNQQTELVTSILQLLNDTNLSHRLADKAKDRAKDFSFTKTLHQTLAIYRTK